jgi:hypothetical protein
MFNKSVLVLLLFLTLFSGCEKKSGDSTIGLTDATTNHSTNGNTTQENSNGFSLDDAEIRSSIKEKDGDVITIYANPTYLTDEVMSSIEIGGHIIKLPTTLEELGDDYKLVGDRYTKKFVSRELTVFDPKFDDTAEQKIIGAVNARYCLLTYKEKPLGDVYICGYEKNELEKCPIIYIFVFGDNMHEDAELKIRNVGIGDRLKDMRKKP